MKVQKCTPDNIERMISVIERYDYIFGLNVKTSGIQELNTKFLRDNKENSNMHPLELIEDDGTLLGVCVAYVAITQPSCIIRSGFFTEEGEKKYSALFLTQQFITLAVDFIESLGVKEFFWLQRQGRSRQLIPFLSNPSLLGFKNNYNLQIAEEIPANTKAKNPLFGKYLFGPMDGQCPKPIVVMNLYKND
jgi:hypothetical protein